MASVGTTLLALQVSAQSLLAADDMYKGLQSNNRQPIPIITEKLGNIIQQIDTCLGQVGICALIVTPEFKLSNNLINDPRGWADLRITLYENATINQGNGGTGIQAVQLAERTVLILHAVPHGVVTGPVGGNEASTCFLGAPQPIEFVNVGPPLQYNCNFQAFVMLNPTYQ